MEIRLTRQPQHRFVLHSFILGLHSSFFKASLNQRWSGGETEGNDNIKWRYELAFDGDGMGLLCKQVCACSRDYDFVQRGGHPVPRQPDLPMDDMSASSR